MRTARLPALGLFVLAPVCAEHLWGCDDSTGHPRTLVGNLVVFSPLYGAPALLIRELARRRRLGWPGHRLAHRRRAAQPAGRQPVGIEADLNRGEPAGVGHAQIDQAIALERLLQPVVRALRDELAGLLDPHFREIGASGRLRDRNDIIDNLTAGGGPADPIDDEQMQGVVVADGVVLLTYASDTAGRRARRTSL